MGKTDIKSLPLEQLEQWAVEYGEKKFRAKQLYQWMHVKLVDDPEQMSNLSAAFRQKIRENCTFTVLKQVTMQESPWTEPANTCLNWKITTWWKVY